MKLRVAQRTNEDIFVFDETGKKPKIVARAGSLDNLLEELGRVTGNEIVVEKYFGDYVSKMLFDIALDMDAAKVK